MQRLLCNSVATVLFGISFYGHAAALTLIYDSGQTLPLAPFLRQSPIEPSPNTIPLNQDKLTISPLVFPVTTPSMQPGQVRPVAKRLAYLHTPLFLIGSDPLSRQWLTQRRTELLQLGAVGLLVEVESQEKFKAMMHLAKGLRLVPVSAESIAKQLGLSHYPLLLSKKGWEQ